MSIRPDEQNLEDPIDKIIEGMDEFMNATKERIRSGDWKESHIKEIMEISTTLWCLQEKLLRIKEETW